MVRFTVGAAGFSLCRVVQTGCEDHASSYSVRSRGGSCHGAERPEREAGHSLRVDVKSWWSYTYTSCAFLACIEATVTFDVFEMSPNLQYLAFSCSWLGRVRFSWRCDGVVLYKFADIRVETGACIFMVKIETMASRSRKSFDNL